MAGPLNGIELLAMGDDIGMCPAVATTGGLATGVAGPVKRVDPRWPCLVGVGQRTVRPAEGPAPEPLALWEDVCRQAAVDATSGLATGSGAMAAGDVLAQRIFAIEDAKESRTAFAEKWTPV